MFKVGKKVVCLRTPTRYHGDIEEFPIHREIYTIRSMQQSTFDGLALYFDEIINEKRQFLEGYVEMNFASINFRPIDYSYGEQVCESLEVMTEPELV